MVTTSRTVTIERLTSKHVDDTLQAAKESVDETFPWMEWCHPGLGRDELAAFMASLEQAWDQGAAYTFAVLDAATGEFLGVAGLNRIHKAEKFGNLHYWVRSGKAGRGIATQAARLICHFGIEDLGLQRIGILVPEGHVASEHVAERLGATREGVLRNASRLHERQMNATQYSIIPSDIGGTLAA
jgi:RimJ/RimL family protein N-acetyltransferase